MKKFLLPLFICAVAIGPFTPGVSAAPAPAAAKVKKPRPPRGTLPKRFKKALELKMGKPLSADQTKKLTAANKARLDSIKAVNEKFYATTAAITGQSTETVRALAKPPKKAPKPAPQA